jgi:hypothetical protein
MDVRVGVQGTGQSFSFIVERDEREQDRRLGDPLTGVGRSGQSSQQAMLRLLKVAKIYAYVSDTQSDFSIQRVRENVEDSLKSSQNREFVNCEFWKASSYLNTLMSQFFLSTLVSMVECVQQDITRLMRDWLDVV